MIRRRHPLLVAVVVVASSLVACSLPYSIWLLPFSTARHLMFGLATERDGARVDRAVWTDSARLGSYDCDFFRRYYWSQFGDRR